MNHSWILIEPNQLPKISDVCNHLLHKFNLRSSCPNGILLFMEGFVLPPSESTRILNDNDIICVKRKGVALTEAIEGVDACNLLDGEVNRREPVDNGVLLLANEEFDNGTGGYQSESEDAEVEKSEDKRSPKETASKKRKPSTKLRSSKKKKHRLIEMNGVEDEAATEDNDINNDECPFMKIISKKIKRNKEKSGESETIIEKVKSPSKVKRKKKHHLGVVIGDEDETVIGEIDNVNNGESILKEKISKKKIKPSEEIKKANGETSDKNIKDDVEGVEQTSTPPDGAEKVSSRSSRRKKAKRQWRRELAKSSENPDTHVEPGISKTVEPEISKTANKEATDHLEGPLKRHQVPAKVMHKNIIEQEGRNHNDNGVTKLVPCVVKPGHIRFEPLDEDEDAKQIEVPDVAFQWNGITSKKKGQKWGLEKFSISKRDDSQKATQEPSIMLKEDAQVPLIDLIAFDQLPLCSSPKEGDVIAYRVLELSSSWTPELSSFRVGKISYYDADNIVLMPVPEYPIVLDNMDENGPDNSLYKEDGSLEIKFAALADVRSLEQSNSDAVKSVSNRVNQTSKVDEKNAASNLMSSSNDKENLSKDPSPVVGNKEGNTWDELEELLSAKKSALLESNEEMKRDSGWNKWSYRALRGSALGPTISLLRSENDI
ncbi:hypothetical protein L1987_16476 [Smallanthus sonchifolius]|uniref:Uncharacterized protein n=1 Tax=Smallanthus sonchifolius TaxID=185202 RepID=A0ACB9J8U6_9ASTR|nr:hypothetical protein L1987_16476 [Smallanthus sonchifolius]